MTVKKKSTKPKFVQYDIDDVINRGGKVSADSKLNQENEEVNEEIRFTLRIPQKLIKQIDKDRQTRVGNVSRNQWILEAVAERFE